jgi:cell division protein FtsB
MKNKRKIRLLFFLGATVLFLIYLFFSSDKRLARHRELNNKIRNRQEDISKIKNQIKTDYSIEELQIDSSLMEKYAREQLDMQKTDEEVFIVEYE